MPEYSYADPLAHEIAGALSDIDHDSPEIFAEESEVGKQDSKEEGNDG